MAQTDYDLIVIGAGIAGLNALHAASLHLPGDARILLVDAKDAPGGMWNMAYDYVRLHQPHPFFTVGNIKWDWQKPDSYLARRDEVQNHLAQCLDKMSADRAITVRFGKMARNLREVRTSKGWHAEVMVSPIGAPDAGETITASRVIDAAGFNYAAPAPIALSADQVGSTTPADLHDMLAARPTAPVYVVGGGKTGMDTILAVQDQDPTREVSLINGGGTYFMRRDQAFPVGLRRWFSGRPPGLAYHDCATRFDGQNEDAVRAHFIATYAANRDPRSQNFVWGILSDEENQRIEAGLHAKIWDYLEDVVDTGEGPQMRLRSGAVQPVAPDSIFVACTGSVLRGTAATTSVPCLSPNDVILSINTRHAMHILTSYASFILSHLFFNGTLRSAGLYFLDLEALLGADKRAFSAATITQSYHNLMMGFRRLPPETRAHFGLDLNQWYPKLRLMLAFNPLRKTAREDVAQCRAALDKVVARFDIKGGMLPEGADS